MTDLEKLAHSIQLQYGLSTKVGEEILGAIEFAIAAGRIEGLKEAIDVIDGNAFIEGTAVADDLETAIRARIQELEGER